MGSVSSGASDPSCSPSSRIGDGGWGAAVVNRDRTGVMGSGVMEVRTDVRDGLANENNAGIGAPWGARRESPP